MCKNKKKTAPKISDCIACISQPLLTLAFTFGPYAISVRCPHLKFPSPEMKFVTARRRLMILSFSSLIIVLPTAKILLDIYYFSVYTDFNRRIVLATDILFSLLSLVTTIPSKINCNLKLMELNALAAIIETRNYYGFQTLIDQETTKIYIRNSYLMRYSCI